ncbi:hypothetical protein ABZY31_26805 [Streptomyces sp. NPDC006529]|uniref:hypothetical protein n=1 Tax=Streptomyces sp. NPDC006529 TaxID=3157177 RepID=UPI0033AE158F
MISTAWDDEAARITALVARMTPPADAERTENFRFIDEVTTLLASRYGKLGLRLGPGDPQWRTCRRLVLRCAFGGRGAGDRRAGGGLAAGIA